MGMKGLWFKAVPERGQQLNRNFSTKTPLALGPCPRFPGRMRSGRTGPRLLFRSPAPRSH